MSKTAPSSTSDADGCLVCGDETDRLRPARFEGFAEPKVVCPACHTVADELGRLDDGGKP